MKAPKTIHVTTFTNGLVGPSLPMLGPIANGGTIIAETAPGCWGPMITPSFRGGHEVTSPVAVQGAEPGDAIVIRIRKVKVTSAVTASGTMGFVEGRFTGDPFVARHCPNCGTKNPPTQVKGIGADAIRCVKCGAEVSPFRLTNGYTIVFNDRRSMAVTVGSAVAKKTCKKCGRGHGPPGRIPSEPRRRPGSGRHPGARHPAPAVRREHRNDPRRQYARLSQRRRFRSVPVVRAP